MRTLSIVELFTSRVADAVIGHEDNECLVEDSFAFQSLQNLAHVMVRLPNGLQVSRPVLLKDFIFWIVGRQFDFGSIDIVSEDFFRFSNRRFKLAHG